MPCDIISKITNLIKRGGGTGPMKPGILYEKKQVPIPAVNPEDEDR